MIYVTLKLNGGDSMPKIVPVSDLRNYKTVLSQVCYGNPVYLTKMVEAIML